jgi:hypothetical protein
MIFSMECKEIELRCIERKLSKVIIYNIIEEILNKGNHGLIGQLFSLDVQTFRPSALMDLQKVINNHSKVFEEIDEVLPLA